MRRVEENRHAGSLQLSKEVESQTGVTISRDTITAYTAEEWHAWVPSTKEASPKAQAQKSPPRGPMLTKMKTTGTLYSGVMRPR